MSLDDEPDRRRKYQATRNRQGMPGKYHSHKRVGIGNPFGAVPTLEQCMICWKEIEGFDNLVEHMAWQHGCKKHIRLQQEYEEEWRRQQEAEQAWKCTIS